MSIPANELSPAHSSIGHWRDFYELCKPRVVVLILFTAIVGMFLASPGMVPWDVLIFASAGIGFASACAASINHLMDRHIDAAMARTRHRPLPMGQLSARTTLIFSLGLGVASMLLLGIFVNVLTATLTFLSLIGYAVIYTMYLKHATPQNIVIGGAAGAAPPVLGWTAVTGTIDPHALLLFIIIFLWTPPHFWALAIYRHKEYAAAGIPMLPVTHGTQFTRLHIVFYTVLLVVASLLPYVFGMSGAFYVAGALVLGTGFLYYAVALYVTASDKLAMKTFRYSILYLMVLFALLLVDHYFLLQQQLQFAPV